ncbi:chloroplast envelope quinone oxidoreductase homolog [Typha angustifolia]|uniref:chloroplast envelope quinone oxidoreductase homolog n=1 Tax=Typha angustifolia TaxID=59011 RepID=UPI003C2B2CEE
MAGKTMHAFQYKSYGGGAASLEYVEIPIPSPKNDEVLIKVEAASINPADWKIQSGILRPFLPPKFPFIPVTDITGEIVEIGSGVNSFKAGDKVLCKLKFWKGCGLAEYAVAPVSFTVHRPPEVSPVEAAGLPIAALTALHALKYIGTKFDGTGKSANILITAASGGVGSYAVQLAKLGNLHVTATCGARNLELVKNLGADEVLDYKTTEGASLRSPSGKQYDYIINCACGTGWSTFEPNLSAEGKVIDVAPGLQSFLTSLLNLVTFSRKKLVPISLALGKEDLKFLVELVKEGKLKTVVDSRHPFEKADEAWAKSMDGHASGKVIIEM